MRHERGHVITPFMSDDIQTEAPKAIVQKEGCLNFLPDSPWAILGFTILLIAIQIASILFPMLNPPGLNMGSWRGGLVIGLYAAPLFLVSTFAAGSMRRLAESDILPSSAAGLAAMSFVMTAAVAMAGKALSGNPKDGAAIWFGIWTVTTIFALKPAGDRILDIVQPKRSR